MFCPLGVFGAHFALLGATLGFLLGALGSQGVLLGVTLASLWLPWLFWDADGTMWGTLGSQVELGVTLGQKWMSFPSIFGAFAMPAHKN